MVDLSESGDPLNDINALAEVCEPGTVVIAVGQVNDVRLYRDLLASGIHDYLLKPLTAGQLRDSLNQAQAVFAAPRHGDGEVTKQHVSYRGRRHSRRSRRLDGGDFPRLAVQRPITSGRPRCSTSMCTSAPARCRSTSSRAAA